MVNVFKEMLSYFQSKFNQTFLEEFSNCIQKHIQKNKGSCILQAFLFFRKKRMKTHPTRYDIVQSHINNNNNWVAITNREITKHNGELRNIYICTHNYKCVVWYSWTVSEYRKVGLFGRWHWENDINPKNYIGAITYIINKILQKL